MLACELIVTVLSDLPSLRLFGWLSAFAMLAALAADLLILRPTVTFLSRLARQIGGKRWHQLEPGQYPSVYRVGLSRLLKAGALSCLTTRRHMKSKRASEGDGRTFVLALSERHEAVVRAYELTFVKAAEDDFDRVIASTPCNRLRS